MAAAVNKGATGKVKHHPVESLFIENDNEIAQEVKSTVKKLVAIDMVTMGQEVLDQISRKTLQIVQTGVRSVVCKAVEQVMLDVLRKNVIRETLDAQTAKYFDTDAAAEWLSKRLFISS